MVTEIWKLYFRHSLVITLIHEIKININQQILGKLNSYQL